MFRASHVFIVSLIMLVVVVLPVAAGTYSFTPSRRDMWDLDHYYYYSWGIEWQIPAGQEITGAVLSIKGINDWENEPNDHLFIHLLDNVALGCRRWNDDQRGGDNWVGNPLIANWSDTNTWAQDLAFDLGAVGLIPTLNSFVSNNSRFGIGFDPDCHYYNSSIKLTICTADPPVPPVPEPSSLLALAAGVLTLGSAGLRLRPSH